MTRWAARAAGAATVAKAGMVRSAASRIGTPLLLTASGVAALVLLPVALAAMTLSVLGAPLSGAVLRLERRFASRHRGWAAGILDLPIADPYREGVPRQATRAVVTDPATWRDLAWLAVHGLAVLAIAVSLFFLLIMAIGGALMPVWYLWFPRLGLIYGLPISNLALAVACVPAGVLVGMLTSRVIGRTPQVLAWLVWWLLAPSATLRLRRRVEELGESRAAVVDAQATALRRIERDLHDGAQATLVSLAMNLGLAEELLAREPQAARELVAEARAAALRALADLRTLVRGIHPPVLADRGLAGAIEALALDAPIPVRTDLELRGRPPAPVESAAYFTVAEALTNMIKHSDAGQAWISLRHSDGQLRVRVVDDGRGGADPSAGSGLDGIRRRLAAFDGTMLLTSPEGGGTEVIAEIPCALSSPKTSPSYGTG